MDATDELWGELRKPWHHPEARLLPCDRCGTLVEPWPAWPVRLCQRCHEAVRDDPAWQPRSWDAAGEQVAGGLEYERIRAEKLAEVDAYKLVLAQQRQTS